MLHGAHRNTSLSNATEGVIVHHRMLESEEQVLNDATILEARNAWLSDRNAARHKYGDIAMWNTRRVTDMSFLFASSSIISSNRLATSAASSFNDDISQWDTSQVTDMASTLGWRRVGGRNGT